MNALSIIINKIKHKNLIGHLQSLMLWEKVKNSKNNRRMTFELVIQRIMNLNKLE